MGLPYDFFEKIKEWCIVIIGTAIGLSLLVGSIYAGLYIVSHVGLPRSFSGSSDFGPVGSNIGNGIESTGGSGFIGLFLGVIIFFVLLFCIGKLLEMIFGE